MADNISGVATRQKSIDGSAPVHVQRVTAVAGDTLTAKIITQGATGQVVLSKNLSRVFAQIVARDGDLYLAPSVTALGSDTTRRKVKTGEAWETSHYLGDVAIKAVAGTVTVEIEEVS